jgi:hypothetical protein
MTAGTHNDADITAVIGATGNGKGVYIKGLLKKLPRSRSILVWSPLEVESDDYAAFIGGVRVFSIDALAKAHAAGKRRIVLVPDDPEDRKLFDRFCRIAWALDGWCIVVEELSDCTMASWAPPAWKKITKAGRHKGLKVIAACQRPADADKSFLGNASEIRCYAVNWPSDQKVMGGIMGVKPDEIATLPKFHYFHRVMETKTTTRGVATLTKP